MKTVLITGASRGIGAAIARKFIPEGKWNLVISCSKDRGGLNKVRQEAEEEGTPCLAFVGDISDETFVRKMFAETARKFGGVDVLICCAGIDWFGVVQDTLLETWNRILSVNLTGPFLAVREAIPQMLAKKSGSILNISSVFGASGGSCESAYSASKGGLNAFTLSLAKELAPSGIRVNALLPGAIDTSMNARLSPIERAALEEEIPLGRMGTAEEAASLAYDIAVRFTYMTGALVPMDGGWN